MKPQARPTLASKRKAAAAPTSIPIVRVLPTARRVRTAPISAGAIARWTPTAAAAAPPAARAALPAAAPADRPAERAARSARAQGRGPAVANAAPQYKKGTLGCLFYIAAGRRQRAEI